MLHEQIFFVFVNSANIWCGVIYIINSEKAEVNTVKILMCPEPNEVAMQRN